MKGEGTRPEDRLILALDVDELALAEKLVQTLVPVGVTRFKIGLQLFTRAGPPAVERVHRLGGKVFLDMKFHDIPHTVGRAVEAAARMGVWMTNVHIQGGSAMMRQALAGAQEGARQNQRAPPLLVGVTVLTSMAERDLLDLGVRKALKDQVLYLARLAQSAGLNGIVASAQEAKVIRWSCGGEFLIVTPGIRPSGEEGGILGIAAAAAKGRDDQQRTAAPSEAIRAGADYLVVGRPILKAADPAEVTRQILEECARV